MALVFVRPEEPEEEPEPEERPLGDMDVRHLRVYAYLKTFLPYHEAQTIFLAGQKIHDMDERTLFYAQAVARVERDVLGAKNHADIDYATYRWKPVGVREFICSPDFLNKEREIYPPVLDAAEELNNGQYVEAVLTGGIGSGKTTLALYTNAYQLYLLSCMRSPHLMYGLDPSSEILLIFQSITKHLALGVDYQRFRSMIDGAPYFRKRFPFNLNWSVKMVFPNRIEVHPVAGTETAAIGQNVMGGVIDELNYMAVIEKSRVAVDKGTYDQAILVYNSIARRRKSRFMENGKMPGILCLVSSKKFPGQFTDQKMAEAETDKSIYVYDKRVWEIKPDDFGKMGWVNIFVGDMTRKPRVLTDEETEAFDSEDRPLIIAVPEEFRGEFEKDVINALREIAGISTLSRHPYFLEVPKVHQAFRKDQPSIFSQSPVDFVTTRITLLKAAFYKPQLPRFAHVDLALSNDSAGMTIGTVTGFRDVGPSGAAAFMPDVRIDGVLEVRPPKGSEIQISKLRDVIIALIRMGLNIRWVTFDQFQSSDAQQILRQSGLITGHQSMDEMPCRAYDFTKSAFYEGRVALPWDPHLQKEILMLEKDVKSGRVDHPPGGSKDCADSLAGVVYGLTMRREIWALYKIPILMIPQAIIADAGKLEKKNERPEYQDVQADTDAEQRHQNRVLASLQRR